jgi:DNA invertase Pin-like site-specific DNA recombinase
MKIGYSRVSTSEQSLAPQDDVLNAEGCQKIYSDVASGAKTERVKLQEALGYLREGDTLVVVKLDRLGRSLKHLIEVVTHLEERGIGFKSLSEGIDTTTSGGRLVFQGYSNDSLNFPPFDQNHPTDEAQTPIISSNYQFKSIKISAFNR